MSTEIAGRGAAQRSSLCVPTILLSLSPRARESESAREEREERETAEVCCAQQVACSQFETTSTHEHRLGASAWAQGSQCVEVVLPDPGPSGEGRGRLRRSTDRAPSTARHGRTPRIGVRRTHGPVAWSPMVVPSLVCVVREGRWSRDFLIFYIFPGRPPP